MYALCFFSDGFCFFYFTLQRYGKKMNYPTIPHKKFFNKYFDIFMNIISYV